jgi:chromosome condensin MukBEF ATPase and DNA-binding subunit MukB
MSPEDARQFRSEIRQFAGNAQQMRPLLKGQAEDLKALEEVLKNLRALDNDKVFADPAQFDRLQTAAADAIKRFEFNLRRRAELKGNEVLLSGDGDVPEEFRKLVEQYYKSLSKGGSEKK